jgi:hypothetical protein
VKTPGRSQQNSSTTDQSSLSAVVFESADDIGQFQAAPVLSEMASRFSERLAEKDARVRAARKLYRFHTAQRRQKGYRINANTNDNIEIAPKPTTEPFQFI